MNSDPKFELRSRSAPIIERAPLPIIEVHGATHIISHVNSAFCRLLGKSKAELLGNSFADIVPLGNECVPILDKVFQTGEAATLMQADPSATPPAQWLYAMWPALDANEQPERVIIQLTKTAQAYQTVAAINEALLISGLRQHEFTEAAETLNKQLKQEIAERKQAEQAKSLLSSIVESSADSIISITLDAVIISWNKAAEELYSYPAEQVLGQSLSMFSLPMDMRDIFVRINKVRQSEKVDLFETKGLLRNGLPICLSMQISPVTDKDGKTSGVSIIARDITERKRVEEMLLDAKEKISHHTTYLEEEVAKRTARLRDSIASLETLTYTMAHDLRAPIRAMKAFTTALLEDVPLDEMGKNYAERIHKAAGRMDQLVNDLLDYGQLTHLEFPIHPVDLKIQIEKILAHLAKDIQTANARIEVIDPLPVIAGNELLLKQALLNLLLNALKFISPEITPNIRIYTETRGSNVRICIEDNGIGIQQQYQERVFGIFQRLHSNEEFSGTGVGLAIVKRAAERMNGTAGVESEPGKGSKFWIELPQG